MLRVMVKNGELFHLGSLGELNKDGHRGMSPAYFDWIFSLCVLAISDQEICVVDEK